MNHGQRSKNTDKEPDKHGIENTTGAKARKKKPPYLYCFPAFFLFRRFLDSFLFYINICLAVM